MNTKQKITDLLSDESNYENGKIQKRPFLILDPAKTFGDTEKLKKDLHCFSRAPTQHGLSLFQHLMSSLILIVDLSFKLPISPPTNANNFDIPLYIPLGLRSQHFFTCLAHVISPGISVSLHSSMLIAIIAFLSNNKYLVKKARTFLETQKGKWINFTKVRDLRDMLFVTTVKLVQCVPQFLTDEENKIYDKLFQIIKLKIAFKKKILVTIPLIPNVKKILHDYRFQCESCNYYRSFTLMTQGEGQNQSQCSVCLIKSDNPYLTTFSGSINSSDVGEKFQHNKSRFASCVCCYNIYEVLHWKDLNVKPECHFCRNQKPSPFVTCSDCTNDYILSDPSLKTKIGVNNEGKWICAICKNTPELAFEEISILLKDLLWNNNKMMNIFNLPASAFNVFNYNYNLFEIFTSKVLWAKIMEMEMKMETETEMKFLEMETETETETEMKSLEMETDSDSDSDSDSIKISGRLNGRKIFKIKELIETIKNIVKELYSSNILCILCLKDKECHKFAPSPCGNSTCKTRICYICQKNWMRQIKPGKVVLPSHLVCPFCKMMPTETIYTKFTCPTKELFSNKHLKYTIKLMDPNFYYGWCKICSKFEQIREVICGGTADVPYSTYDNFICKKCKETELRYHRAELPPRSAPALVRLTPAQTFWKKNFTPAPSTRTISKEEIMEELEKIMKENMKEKFMEKSYWTML